ncbi:MAG: hypothetical protein ACTSU2_00975 [Promethearchaeota archaeon]
MGRRKRQKVVYKPVKRLPKVFTCPRCEQKTMVAKKIKGTNKAIVQCGSCGLEQEVDDVEIYEPVDHFGEFIDIYYSDQELARLKKRAERLENKQQWSELAFVYSYIADICNQNAKIAKEELDKQKSKDPDLQKTIDEWEAKEKEYRALSRDIFQKLELKELEEGVEDELFENEDEQEFELVEDARAKKKKAKRGRDLDEILEDKGFLEF